MTKGKNYVTENISIESAEILFLNFSGNQTAYNPAGKREFSVIIPTEELAKKLASDGWNVRYLKPRDEGDAERPYMTVNVSFSGRPPMVKMITSSGQTILDEESIGTLDYADITNVDLIISPYNWEVNGKSGVKGYLRSMYVTIQEDEFAKKYTEDVPF